MSEEKLNPKSQKFEFQAEVSSVLDIVINSLYTNKEIFVRELISNSSDALEKIRQVALTEKDIADKDLPYEIRIELDEKAKTFSVSDTGIGMTKDELVRNLGTIAHSGSKEFLTRLAEAAKKDVNLIGQFGVGFYSAFMAAKHITVETRSYKADAEGCEWSSSGSHDFTIAAKEGIRRGTKITLDLKEECDEFANPQTIKQIVQQYSNFVSFPIFVNGDKINTVQAIWTRNKSEIKEEEYNEFFKFAANSIEEPLFTFHFITDAPIQIYSLLFVPKVNMEQFGFKRYESGVDLHCKKVLIEKRVDWLLPQWLRFLHGVIDSEDFPLNISRETLQNNAQIKKVGKIITSRFIKFLDEKAQHNPEQYAEFYKQFGGFIREGITTDFEHREEIGGLLRFESSKTEPGKMTSLAEYVSRSQENQKEIYFISGPTRKAIENGPYIEAFKNRDIEALFSNDVIDDLALTTMGRFKEKDIVSGDNADLDLSAFPEISGGEDKPKEKSLEREEIQALCGWLKKTFGEKIESVRESKRLFSNPAMLVNPDKNFSGSMQKLFQMMNKDTAFIGKKSLEINPGHPIMIKLSRLKDSDEKFATVIAEQILDSALMSAGLLVEPDSMIKRIYEIIERAEG